jgi:dipeptidyl-peptidase-4
LGEVELRDMEDMVDWLKSQPFVDDKRIGLWGWSYGGFMTIYALTHSESFKMGIAGAPVTDWTLYDSVYTERYMGLPEENREGYRKSSTLESALRLKGRLLLIHGALDENVHVQNTYKLADRLQRAGRQFELMIYPQSRHSIQSPRRMKHLRDLMTRFILEHL